MIQVYSNTIHRATREGDEDIGSIMVVIDAKTWDALAAAVEVAYDDPESTPTEYAEAAKELWEFFHAGVAA